MQFVSVAVDGVHLQEVEEGPGDEETFSEGKAFQVAHVEGQRVGGGRNGAETNQLTHDIPYPDSWKEITLKIERGLGIWLGTVISVY